MDNLLVLIISPDNLKNLLQNFERYLREDIREGVYTNMLIFLFDI